MAHGMARTTPVPPGAVTDARSGVSVAPREYAANAPDTASMTASGSSSARTSSLLSNRVIGELPLIMERTHRSAGSERPVRVGGWRVPGDTDAQTVGAGGFGKLEAFSPANREAILWGGYRGTVTSRVRTGTQARVAQWQSRGLISPWSGVQLSPLAPDHALLAAACPATRKSAPSRGRSVCKTAARPERRVFRGCEGVERPEPAGFKAYCRSRGPIHASRGWRVPCLLVSEVRLRRAVWRAFA